MNTDIQSNIYLLIMDQTIAFFSFDILLLILFSFSRTTKITGIRSLQRAVNFEALLITSAVEASPSSFNRVRTFFLDSSLFNNNKYHFQ